MKNYIQPGDSITVPAPTDVKSGSLVVVGDLFGVAQFSAVSGDSVEISTKGVFSLPKAGAQAWTIGAKVYYVAADKNLSTTASGNLFIGHAVAAAINPSDNGIVRLSV
jgi:predicted RecA/RadA family phage recombinase